MTEMALSKLKERLQNESESIQSGSKHLKLVKMVDENFYDNFIFGRKLCSNDQDVVDLFSKSFSIVRIYQIIL